MLSMCVCVMSCIYVYTYVVLQRSLSRDRGVWARRRRRPRGLVVVLCGLFSWFCLWFFFSVCFTAVEMSAMNSTIACVPYAGIIICIMNDGFNNNATHGVVWINASVGWCFVDHNGEDGDGWEYGELKV